MNNNRICNSQAFTLIESLVAVSILMLSVAGPLFAANRAIVATGIARDRLTASYLAQEGIEYMHKIRDDGYLRAYGENSFTASSVGWGYFLSNITACDPTSNALNACKLDVSLISLAGCKIGTTCGPLYLSNGVYTQLATGTKTPFTRTIQTVASDSNSPTKDERITSTVSWSYRGVPYSVMVTDHFTPWQ